jgi:two-component system, NtrC family, response regulator AtoC
VMLGAGDDTRRAALAVRLGAVDYLAEPFQQSELESVLNQHLVPITGVPDKADDSEATVINLSEGACFVCASPAMKRIYAQVSVIAKFDMPVLMLGESGTGKEVLSLLIHHLSPRANYPFLKVNCAAVPADLLES